MAKSSLALIGQTVEAALQRKTQTIKRYVAGFEIEEEVAIVGNKASQSFAADTHCLHKRLSDAQIEPIQILPKSWWDKMVEGSGLLDFQPVDGFVTVNAGAITDKVRQDFMHVVAFFGIVTLLAAILIKPAFAVFPDIGDWAFAIAGASAFVITVCVSCHPRMSAAFCTAVYLGRKGGDKAFLATLLANKAHGRIESTRVAISLPKPPADVAEVLLRADRAFISMRVAAVKEAISLSPSPSELIRTELRKQYVEEARMRREAIAAWADPIIYVVDGSAVAIIAQFGDFPIEQQLVDKVVEMNF